MEEAVHLVWSFKMAKNTKQTSATVASKAAKILSNPRSSAAAKSVAASDLAQTRPHPKR
jgi:hypothetical protein